MKNTHGIVTGVLAIAVIILFIMQLFGKSKNGVVAANYQTDTSLVNKGVIRIKFVESDSITSNWDFAKDLMTQFEEDQKIREERFRGMEGSLQSKVKKLEKDAPTLTEREIGMRQEELQRLQQQYMADGQELQNKAQIQQEQMSIQLGDSLKAFFPGFAQQVGADIIMNNSSIVTTMFYVSPSLNVTNLAITGLNERYKKFNPKPVETGDKGK
jgi:Skp family chaperone for outer membrane proteins